MRLAVLACSTVLLSGCSWLGYDFNLFGGSNNSEHGSYQGYGTYQGPSPYMQPQRHGQQAHVQQAYGQQAQTQQAFGQQAQNGCAIRSVTQAMPQGCNPQDVRIALPLPEYGVSVNGESRYTSGSYGTAIDDVGSAKMAASDVMHKTWRRPLLRLTGSMGFDTSVSGEAFNTTSFTDLYAPGTQSSVSISGSPADGQVITSAYSADNFKTESTKVSFSDLYSAPFSTKLGAEFQLDERLALYTNAGYTHAVSRNSSGREVIGDAVLTSSVQNYATTTTTDANGNQMESLPMALGAPLVTVSTLPDTLLAKSTFKMSDLKRLDAEIGSRYYFKDAFTDYLVKPFNPYVGASIGVSYYDDLALSQTSERLVLSPYIDSTTADASYVSAGSTTNETVISGSWLPNAGLTVGGEWQISPKAAFALETGVRVEGRRPLEINDGKTAANLSIPLTLRGSIGF